MAEADFRHLKIQIGLEAFTTAFENGHRLTAQDAIALALCGSERA